MDPDCRSETTGDHQGGRTIARVGERGLPTSAGHPPPFGEVGGDPDGESLNARAAQEFQNFW